MKVSQKINLFFALSCLFIAIMTDGFISAINYASAAINAYNFLTL